jgi:steroid 5-alpha reductase family enzyme
MTFLLVKFSGVTMLEETIVDRRPAYRAYIAEHQRVHTRISRDHGNRTGQEGRVP